MSDENEITSGEGPETSDRDGPAESAGANLERRKFVAKTAALAGAAGIVGAAGLAKSAVAAEAGKSCGPNPRTMSVTFDFHSTGTGAPNFRELSSQLSRSGETVLGLTRNFTEENGWGEWLRDASGDASAMDLRAIGFKHVPFRTGGDGGGGLVKDPIRRIR